MGDHGRSGGGDAPRLARLVAKVWLPLVTLVVAAVAAMVVWSVRGTFGTGISTAGAGGKDSQIVQFNPKRITYEVFGDIGTGGTLNYLDTKVLPNQVEIASLPWTHTETVVATTTTASVAVQVGGSRVGCRIKVNGQVRDEQVATGVHAATACTVLSA